MVVVIDDDAVQGSVIAQSICQRGVSAEHILHWSGLEKLLARSSISCLVIDYYLNDGWFGPEVAKLLRSFGCNGIPIYFTSADESPVVRRQCEAAAYPFVSKRNRWLLVNLVVASVLAQPTYRPLKSG